MNKRLGMFAPLGMLTALVVTLFTATAPVPANASDTPRQEITNVGSGYLVDVMWASVAPYTGVFLWPNNNSASQEFNLLDSGDGFFRIQARHSGLCLMLDLRLRPFVNGTPIIQHSSCDAGSGVPAGLCRFRRGSTCGNTIPGSWDRPVAAVASAGQGKAWTTRAKAVDELPLRNPLWLGTIVETSDPSSINEERKPSSTPARRLGPPVRDGWP